MRAYVGGYTTPDRDGRGAGIELYEVPGPGRPWRHIRRFDVGDNPSMLRLGPGGQVLYAAHGAREEISAHAIDPATGDLTPLARVPAGGTNPVDLAFSPDGRAMVSANYTGGTVAVLPLGPDGAPHPPAQAIPLVGARGPHPTEQSGPHPHGTTLDPSGHFLFVPDKGLDRVFVFRFTESVSRSGDAPGGPVLTVVSSAVSSPGAGPRHAAFHAEHRLLYVLNELDSTVEAFRWDEAAGRLEGMQILSTLPEGATTANTGAEILVAASGRTVYASNRGHDSIATFAVDEETGLLRWLGTTSVQGRGPRFFALDPGGQGLYVGNQDTDAIVWLPLGEDGRPGEGMEVARVGSPSAICFTGA